MMLLISIGYGFVARNLKSCKVKNTLQLLLIFLIKNTWLVISVIFGRAKTTAASLLGLLRPIVLHAVCLIVKASVIFANSASWCLGVDFFVNSDHYQIDDTCSLKITTIN